MKICQMKEKLYDDKIIKMEKIVYSIDNFQDVFFLYYRIVKCGRVLLNILI